MIHKHYLSVTSYIETHKDRFLKELFEILKLPSISADPAYAPTMQITAKAIARQLTMAGADNVQLLPTGGFPVVYADKMIDPTLPTVLVYGHYDVQPSVPLELWDNPPFEPIVKDEKIYARGACDDKGQIFMHIKALEIMLNTHHLPCNVKFIIEGEEEIGSDHLPPFLESNKELLMADVILISDTAMIANDIPSVDTGLRGLSYLEVEVTGPSRDLHSGVYGGAVANPINVLSKMIASLHDDDNKITVPGFYDDVLVLSAEERMKLAAAPFELSNYKNDLHIDDVWGEIGYSTTERASIRPTLDVNGIWGGYIGEGAKTVLPSKAHAKISMRLVPNQSSLRITELFQNYFTSIAPAAVKVKVTPHHGGEAYVLPTDSLEYRAAEKAMEFTFGKKPVPTRGGGSIPIVAMFEKVLGIKSVLLGFGLDTDAIHSPNEHYGLFNFYKGIETIPYFYQFYAEAMAQKTK
jgi:acetylornithine deacetylase/succinyl-diaminopimelate desuccinylase-like protein